MAKGTSWAKATSNRKKIKPVALQVTRHQVVRKFKKNKLKNSVATF